jgi:hypothetical protein
MPIGGRISWTSISKPSGPYPKLAFALGVLEHGNVRYRVDGRDFMLDVFINNVSRCDRRRVASELLAPESSAPSDGRRALAQLLSKHLLVLLILTNHVGPGLCASTHTPGLSGDTPRPLPGPFPAPHPSSRPQVI